MVIEKIIILGERASKYDSSGNDRIKAQRKGAANDDVTEEMIK